MKFGLYLISKRNIRLVCELGDLFKNKSDEGVHLMKGVSKNIFYVL